MQVIKGGWVGQTFALAKLNDSSGGKTSKNRLSKEERKGMAETFIKRYQASNDGNFPSLRLTQKEVGGSFYTVREIFREIIQENRVLAPPKLPSVEENMENLDSFLEHFPLGSVSVDPKDTQTLLNEYEFRREKVLNSRKFTELHRGSLENENVINGSIHHTMVKNEEFEEPKHTELEEPKHTELEGQKDEVKDIEMLEDVVVEAHPPRSVLNAVYNMEAKTSEKDESFVHDEINLFYDSSEMVDTKLEEEIVNPLPEFKSIEIVTTQSHFSTDENQLEVDTIADVKVEDTPAKDKASSSPNDISPQNLDGNNSSSFLQKLTFEETTANTTQKQTVGATLNRINLESWEATTTKKPNDHEANPIVSFIRSLVTAFVKFWSE